MIALAIAIATVQSFPEKPRHCGDLCLLFERGSFDLPHINTRAPDHPEAVFNNYIFCTNTAITAAGLSASSTDDEVDKAFQTAYDSCSRERVAANAAITKLIRASKPKNSPSEIADFAEMGRILFTMNANQKLVQALLGPTAWAAYQAGLRSSYPNFKWRSR